GVKKRDLTDLLEVGANAVSGSSKLRILASLTQGGRLIFVPDAGTSVFFFLFVFFLDVLIGFNAFFVVRYRWIEVSLRLLFILVSVNVLLLYCFLIARVRGSLSRRGRLFCC